MNEEQKQEFFEWYQLMKDRAREVWNDPEVKLEFKQIFVQGATEPIGIWRDRRQRLGQQKLMQDQQQSNSNPVRSEQKPVSSEQPKNQAVPPKPQSKPVDSVMDIVNAHKDKMRIDGDKVVLTGKIDDYWTVIDEFKHRGWKHTPSEKLNTGKWKDGYFEYMGVKA